MMRRKSSLAGRMVRRLLVTAVVVTVVGIPAAFFFVPKLAGSTWARAKFEQMFTSLSGGPVKMEKFEVSWKEGVRAVNVTSEGARRGDLEVSTKTKEVRLLPKVKNFLGRAVKVEARLEQPVINVRQRLETPGRGRPDPARPDGFRVVREMDLEFIVVNDGTITYDSEAFNAPVTLTGLNLKADLCSRHDAIRMVLHECTATLNGGAFSLTGSIDIRPGAAEGKVEMLGKDIQANDLLAEALKHLVPLFQTSSPGSVTGTMDLRLRAEGRGDSVEMMWKNAEGAGEVAFTGTLARARLLDELAASLEDPAIGFVHLSRVEARLRLADGRVHNVSTDAKGATEEIHLTGWVDPAGNQDLLVSMDGHPEGPSAKVIAAANENGGLRIVGTLAAPVLKKVN